MPLILPGNVATATASTGYNVANSCRFDGADSLQRSKGTQSSLQIGTYSFWIKRTNIDGTQHFVYSNSVDASNKGYYSLRADEKFRIVSDASSGELVLETSQLLRDPTAWMHIVIRIDTTQSTAANRCIFYINGVAVTALDTTTYPDQNANLKIFEGGETDKEFIGGMTGETSNLHCYLAEFVFCDGQSLAPTSFGEFDEDSPTIWKPIDVSGLTFGNQGFYLDFEDSSALGNSSNSNNFGTVNNLTAIDQATDTCTNNFCTMNPLVVNSGLTFSEGNLNVVASNANYRHAVSTMAVQSGKWYAEFKAVSGFSGVDKNVGIYRTDNAYSATTGLGNYTSGTTWCYGATGNVRTSNGNNDTGEATFTDGDIIAVAMDLDNNKLYFAKNNAWINSGDPESGATGTGSYAIVAGDFYHFAVTSISSGGAALWSCNFGSPSYANSSDAADANGYGAFEYAPPSGYLSLCTKNLGSDGG